MASRRIMLWQDYRVPLLLAVCAAAVRLAFCFYFFPQYLSSYATVGTQYFFDSYREIALQLSLGNGYRLYSGGPLVLNRPPGYVLALLLCLPGSSYCRAIMHVQNALLGGAAVLLSFVLAMRCLNDRRRALLASSAVAFWPFLVWESKVSVPENLLVALVPLLFILVHNFYTERPALRRALMAGAVMGGIMLTHGYYQAALPVLLLSFSCAACSSARRLRLRWIAGFLAGVLIIVCPWVVRNYLAAGYPVGIATGFGYHYFKGLHNYQVLLSGGNYFRDLDPDADKFIMSKLEDAGMVYPGDNLFRSDPKINEYLDREALRDVLKRPLFFIERGIIRFVIPWLHQQSLTRTALNALLVLPLFVCAALGAFRMRRSAFAVCLCLFLLTVNFFISAVFPEAIPMRYALPLIPLAALLGASGINWNPVLNTDAKTQE